MKRDKVKSIFCFCLDFVVFAMFLLCMIRSSDSENISNDSNSSSYFYVEIIMEEHIVIAIIQVVILCERSDNRLCTSVKDQCFVAFRLIISGF